MRVLSFLILYFVSHHLFAQQNLFNVPSSEITVKKGVFFQQQFNINKAIQSNTNLCVGLGRNFEIGVNVIGLQSSNYFKNIIINDSLDDEPLGVFTLQKVFQASRFLKIGIGGQFGTNIVKQNAQKREFADFLYVNTHSAFFHEKLRLIAGINYGDKGYVGEKSRIGFMAGIEYTVSQKFHLVGDWIAGKSPIGVGVLGFIYYVTPKIPLSFGWQIPNSNKNAHAFVFELTYVPVAFEK